MTHAGKILILSLAVFTLSSSARAMVSGFPYEGITNRNVFNLKLVDNTIPTNAPTPPVKLTLTGITTMTGVKLALMSAQPRSGQPAYYSLTEGQAEDQIEVIAIDEKARTVKVNNHGIPQTLDFLNDGAKFNPTPGPIGTPGAQIGTPGIPSPYGNGALPPNATSNPLRTIPTRPLRTPTVPGTPGAPGYPYGAVAPNGAAVSPNGLTPEEEQLLQEARQAKEQMQNPQGQPPNNGMPGLPIHHRFPNSP